MVWLPISAEEKTVDRVKKKLADIAGFLSHAPALPAEKIGLFDGKCGLALFFFYYGLLTDDEAHYRRGAALIEEVIEYINGHPCEPGYYNGMAGVAWVIGHLQENRFLEIDGETLDSLDAYLYPAMMNLARDGRFDLLFGGLGCAQYFSFRPIDGQTASYLGDFIEELARQARPDEESGGLKWPEKSATDLEGEEIFNLGMAHGMPGIIVFLSHIYQTGIHRDKVLPLLTGAVHYVLGQGLDDSFLSCFPLVACRGVPPRSSRLAWCYGDPGVGMALWRAALSTADEKWKRQALDILTRAAKRRDLKENQVVDACLCHGAAGLLHIFNRLFQKSAIPAFKEAALYWLDQALLMGEQASATAGYHIRLKIEDGKAAWGSAHDLLVGVPGIGLALMAAISAHEPKWDGCFLLSHPATDRIDDSSIKP